VIKLSFQAIEFAAGAVLAAALAAGAALPPVTPRQAVRNLEAAFAALRSLEAEFEQQHSSAVIATPLQETGKFYFQKPDRMRWEYGEPEPQVFVFKEGRVWNYVPDDNQLFLYALSPEQQNAAVFELLTGRARLEDDYLIEPAEFPTGRKPAVQIKLVPKKDADFTHILVELDARTWLIDRLITLDWAGSRQEFTFRKLKINPRLPPSTFEIKVPAGTEIIGDSPASSDKDAL
jgi:outer membrane lipoprotein carrier protein